MTYRFTIFCFAVILIGDACRTSRPAATPATPVTGTIVAEGLLTCFAPGTTLNGQPVWCEASAVLFDGTNVWFANDKDVPPGQGPVFLKTPATLADSTQLPTYLTHPAYAAGRKYEDFTQTPSPDRAGGNPAPFVLLTTAFDRVKPGSTDWDGYNTILYWRRGDAQRPRVLAPDDTSQTSIAYRPRIAQVLASAEFPGAVPYFKIEGLAATDRQLLFGIREEGRTFEQFSYRTKIIGVSYQVDQTGDGERIRLADDWRVIADFDPARADSTLPRPLGLSSLEFDAGHNRFYLLTSLEFNGQLDAFLWTISPDDLSANKPFALVRDARGQPLRFGHKAEDLTPLPGNRLLLIHDDDRVRTRVGSRTRQPHQAAYTIVQLNR